MSKTGTLEDGAYLLVTAILFAGVAWLFWSGAKEWGFPILILLTAGGLLMNRVRHRKALKARLDELRKMQSEGSQQPPA